MDRFLDLLTGNGLPQEYKAMFIESFQKRAFERNSYLTAPEQTRKIIFIERGLVRQFKVRVRLNHEEEVNNAFFFEGDMIGPLHSYLVTEPIDYYLQALETTQVWMATASSLKDTFQRFPDLFEFSCRLHLTLGSNCRKVPDMLRLPTALERYNYMLHFFPQFKRVKQKDLASFLNIGEHHLSKILHS